VRIVVLAQIVALAACTRSASGPVQGVTALAGPIIAEAGATIISQRADGTIIDTETADATGHADVQIEPGAYVTAVFPALIEPQPTDISLVTVPITADDSELVIHGPPHASVPLVVAALTVSAPQLPGAASYRVDLGCNAQTAASLPGVFNVLAQCEGTDINIDVLVRGFDGSDNLLGYGAAREPIGMDQAGDPIADFSLASWATTGTMVPVTQTGTTATVALTLISDTLSFPTPDVAGGQALVWNGLVVDSSIVGATMGDQAASQYAPGTPSAIAVGTSDFMGEISAPTLALEATLEASWPAVTIAGPDALDLHASWSGTMANLTWDAVVTPDTTQIAFPQVDPTTAQVISLPDDPTMIDGELTAIDSSDLASFSDLQAAGIFANAQIVPAPATGEIRTSNAVFGQ
jgi:hypothetical protein